jgi:glycosyltransferase involved in cell wall biosynthesis
VAAPGDTTSSDEGNDPVAAGSQRPAARVGVVGMSIDDPCGVRDHAQRLADGLTGDALACSLHWLSRSHGSLAGERREVRAWAARLDGELEREHADAVLLHYSVFAFSHRGVPLLARPILAALRRSQLPLVTFMHEYAYPWRLGGARGKVWAATQRVVLREVVRSSSVLVVSADARAGWLRSRAWLPDRPIAVAPVFSNLPAAAAQPAPAGASGRATLGLFGYGHEGVDVATVLDALAEVRARAGEVRLSLLGAPGEPSPAASRWRREAGRRGLGEAIEFSGRLPSQELADALAASDVLLFAERGGPTSRKTTLAASLASGRPVVALDGPDSWPQLAGAGGAVIVAPWSRALADAIVVLLEDRAASERQGQLGRSFAERAMSVESSVQVLGAALRAAIDGRQS